ncbi:MAG TPA: hypothetical protein VGY53_03615, partial [Isosphaeraceae bacterium]|nr:hypothetical protein [Isosphaeraceae bacterium]
MNISSSFHSSRALPLGFLGFLCLIFCVEVYLTIREPDLIKGHLIDWRLTGRSVAREAPGCEVLCFGDSLVKYGIAPRVIEKRTGKRAYNFA